MVPVIWSTTDITFCHFGPFSALLPLPLNNPKNQYFEKMKTIPGDIIIFIYKWQSYDVWFLRYGTRQKKCFVNLDCFCPFTPQKIKILKK